MNWWNYWGQTKQQEICANFPVIINRNYTISPFDTGATISCMFKACFNKLQLKPKLVETNIYKVNGVDGSTICPIGMTSYTVRFPKKFQQQFIIWENLVQTVILGLDVSYNYVLGIDWFSSNQLNLHQGPKSIVISDPAPFPLRVNDITTTTYTH